MPRKSCLFRRETIKIQDNKLRMKNMFIFRLQKENNLLSKFKASLKPVGGVPGVMMKGISAKCEAKNVTATEEMEDVSRNVCEEVEVEENVPDELCGENETLSEFLSVVAQVKKVSEYEGNSQQVMNNAAKNNENKDIVVIDDDIIEVNEKAPNFTISSDDEIHLVNEGEEDDILIPTLEQYQPFSLVGIPTIQEEIVDPFVRLQPFASLCAKSSNIVERDSKKRKKLQSTTFSEEFKRKPKQAKVSHVFH